MSYFAILLLKDVLTESSSSVLSLPVSLNKRDSHNFSKQFNNFWVDWSTPSEHPLQSTTKPFSDFIQHWTLLVYQLSDSCLSSTGIIHSLHHFVIYPRNTYQLSRLHQRYIFFQFQYVSRSWPIYLSEYTIKLPMYSQYITMILSYT